MNKLIKPLGLLALVIIVCAVVVRTLTGAETLADYAEKNPDIAYATPLQTSKTEAANSPSSGGTPLPSASPEAISSSTPAAGSSSKDETEDNSAAGRHIFSGPPELQELYQPGFFQEPLNENLIAYISGISFPVTAEEAEAIAGQGDAGTVTNIAENADAIAISYDELRHLAVQYYDFNGEVQEGELICSQSIAGDLLEIFYELYKNKYPIEKIRLIEEYDGDDTLSMLDNNTSGFNYRVVDGTTSLSKHALGRAVDINPFYNPYVVFKKDGSTYISPKGSEIYTDRSHDFPYKIDENDLCYQLFKQHGFTWGGDWKTMKDYQHFQK